MMSMGGLGIESPVTGRDYVPRYVVPSPLYTIVSQKAAQYFKLSESFGVGRPAGRYGRARARKARLYH